MAEETTIEEQQETKKKGGKLKYVIILVVLLLLGGAGFFFKDTILGMIGLGGDEAAQEEVAAEGEGEAALPPDASGPMVAIAPFVANLQDPLGKRYVKLAMQVELRDEDAVALFNESEIKVKDMLIRLLGGKRPQDMLGQQNQLEFKQEVVNRLNQILGPGRVLNIYFSEFILQ